MISKVKGSFGSFKGQADVREDRANSTITGIVDVSSINTDDQTRDGHLRSSDFFDAENYPSMSFITTKWEQEEGSDDITLTGELTIKNVTLPVTFKGEFGGVQVDAYGFTRAGLELTTKINRTDFGLNWNSPLATGGVLVGEDVTIVIDAQGVLTQPESDEDVEPALV
jgi:polyisoprenoid-binding protein YceI